MEEQINIAALLEWYLQSGVDASCADAPSLLQPQTIKAVPTTPTVQSPSLAGAAQPVARQAVASLAQTSIEACQNARQLCERASTLDELRQVMEKFEGCALKFTAKSTVFGHGPLNAPVMLVGEAPGTEEDKIGEPFVGPCGQLLTKMLAAVNLKREDVYITNTVPWRPPGNRTPTDGEIAVCLPFLKRQIELVRPKVLLLLGGIAAHAVLDTDEPISKLRGRWLEYKPIGKEAVATLASYHPSYLLRTTAQKAKSWSDLLRVAKKLKEN
jgi:DNA polymerase